VGEIDDETHRFKDALVVLVIDSISKREVKRVKFPLADADVLQSSFRDDQRPPFCGEQTNPEFPSTGKVLPVFMETDRHYTICGVECLFNAVSMMNINIYV
jgi:hypothetical protein